LREPQRCNPLMSRPPQYSWAASERLFDAFHLQPRRITKGSGWRNSLTEWNTLRESWIFAYSLTHNKKSKKKICIPGNARAFFISTINRNAVWSFILPVFHKSHLIFMYKQSFYYIKKNKCPSSRYVKITNSIFYIICNWNKIGNN